MKKFVFSFVALFVSLVASMSASASELQAAPATDQQENGAIAAASMTNADVVNRLVGMFDVVATGQGRNSSKVDFAPFTKEYESEIVADGDDIIIKNCDGNGNNFRGTVNAEEMCIDFEPVPYVSYWYTATAPDCESGFKAYISEDFNTITFDEWYRVYITNTVTIYDMIETQVLTRQPEIVTEWSVTATSAYTREDGTPSWYVSGREDVTLTKYSKGEKVYYEISTLGGDYNKQHNAQFSVNEDGTLKFLNWGSYSRYLYIQNDYDVMYPLVEVSSFEGNEKGGAVSFGYDYCSVYYGSTDELGTYTLSWGSYIPATVITDPADGSEVESFSRIEYTFPDYGLADFDITNKTYKVTIVDENGNPACETVVLSYGTDYNQLEVYCSPVTEPGTYTITIHKGSVYLDGEVYNHDIVTKLTVVADWNGEVELQESVSSMDDFQHFNVKFPYARDLKTTNYGVLGAVYDASGAVYGLIFSTPSANHAGSVDVMGSTAIVHFEPLADVAARVGEATAAAYAQKVAGFIAPASGVATVYICPKSFSAGGEVYDASIMAEYYIAGNGQTTGIESIATENGRKEYFDLTGRKVARPAKGQLLISNGVKVVK